LKVCVLDSDLRQSGLVGQFVDGGSADILDLVLDGDLRQQRLVGQFLDGGPEFFAGLFVTIRAFA
jgi:hypothetical protein